MKIMKALTFIFIVGFVLIGVIKDKIVINPTESMPIGVYWREDKILERGDIVLACLPQNEVSELFIDRSYLYATRCGTAKGKILKEIVGVPGDHIEINAFGVSVNGKRIDRSLPQAEDSKGRKMPQERLKKVLQADEYILLGHHPHSLDSRYLGVFYRNQILSSVKPLVLLGND